MEEREFLKQTKKVNSPRVHKVTNSWGVYDAYKYYRKNKPSDKKYILTESQYFSIIRKINEALREQLYLGNDLVFPARMGKLEVRKREATVEKKDGKYINTYPINWDATLKLWYEDPQCYKDRFLVKMIEPEVFRVLYNKSAANFENKSFYLFTPNRELKLGLKKVIKQNKFDAFKMNK